MYAVGMYRLLNIGFITIALSAPIALSEHMVIPPQKDVEIFFVGDVMLDRYIRQVGKKKGYEHVFSCVAPTLSAYDVVVGNLEGPVTNEKSQSIQSSIGEPHNTRFTFSPESLAELRKYFDVVSIGNNHIYDFGEEGIEETITHLSKENIVWVGDPRNEISQTIFQEGLSISFVSYNQFFGSASTTITNIERAEGDIIVVLAHWGDEYVDANELQRRHAALFAQAGADIIIGSHPHVIQEYEKIGNTHIFYSLGNFIFDQYFSPEVQRGLGVLVTVDSKGIKSLQTQLFVLDEANIVCPATQRSGIALPM